MASDFFLTYTVKYKLSNGVRSISEIIDWRRKVIWFRTGHSKRDTITPYFLLDLNFQYFFIHTFSFHVLGLSPKITDLLVIYFVTFILVQRCSMWIWSNAHTFKAHCWFWHTDWLSSVVWKQSTHWEIWVISLAESWMVTIENAHSKKKQLLIIFVFVNGCLINVSMWL